MDTITFSALVAEVNEVIWPDGVPDNLVKAIRQFYVDGLIEVQRYVDCYQDNHIDVFPHSATFFRCGISSFAGPPGVIERLIVVENEICNPVTYHPRSFDELSCWSRRFNELVTPPTNEGLPELPLGFKYPDKSTDSEFGRALRGLWAIHKSNIYVAPWLQSTESVIIEWHGFKRKWADIDRVPDEDDLKRTLRYYVQKEYARDFEKDLVDAKNYEGEYREALSDLMNDCRERRRTQVDKTCEEEVEALSATATPPEQVTPESVTVFAVIGDYGMQSQEADDVAALVKSWNPEFVVTTGDNNYPSGQAATIDLNVGRNWRPFIHPYIGNQPLKTGETDATFNRFFPSLGNHDLDNVGTPGQPYYDYFPIPTTTNNKRYYDFVWGHCHIFVLNSGLKTDEDFPIEPDGNDTFSIQAEWLQMRALKSTARWKIAIVHQPPYTSNLGNPAQPAGRWDYKGLGLDILLSGHGHGYERLSVDDFPYIVNGAGGSVPLYTFGPPVLGSLVRYQADWGAQKVTATCHELRLEFWTRGNQLIDTLVLT